MKPEKTIELTIALLRAYAGADGSEDVAETIISDPARWAASSAFPPAYQAAAELLNDAFSQLAKSAGSPLAAMKRIAKEATRDELKGAWTDAEGRTCVCSGFHAVRLRVPIGGLPTVPEYEGLEQHFSRGKTDISLPSIEELKSHIAKHGLKRSVISKRIFQLAPQVYVNPFYLLDVMECLPDAKCSTTLRVKAGYATPFSVNPLYFQGEKGEGILCTMQPGTEAQA